MEIDMRDFLRDRDRKIRAEVAEGIAAAIEAYNATLGAGDDVFQDEGKAYLAEAAAIARGYTHTGQDPADRKDSK